MEDLQFDEEKREEALEDLKVNYLKIGHPIAFSGQTKIYDHYDGLISKEEIQKFLATVYSYTRHQEKRKQATNPTFHYYKRYQIQIDLVDVRNLKEDNDDHSYIFNAIDIFTRHAWSRMLKTKKPHEIVKAFRSILEEAQINPLFVAHDKGGEFKNSTFKNFCQEKGIRNFYLQTKAAFVERFNRTLQSIMYKYMTQYETLTYHDKLQDFIKTYNSRKHRMIQMTPEEAEMDENQDRLSYENESYQSQFFSYKKKRPKFKVGNRVRITKIAGKFFRGYKPRFVEEVFVISKVLTKMPVAMYDLETIDGKENILGRFYQNELTLVNQDTYRIEKIVKRKGNKVYVKWRGFPSSMNSWQLEKNVKNVSKGSVFKDIRETLD